MGISYDRRSGSCKTTYRYAHAFSSIFSRPLAIEVEYIIEHFSMARATILACLIKPLRVRLHPVRAFRVYNSSYPPSPFQTPLHLLPMSSYWSSFSDFDHNPTAPVRDEFQRLAKLKGWMGKGKKKTNRRHEEWGQCFQSEFEKYYGDDTSSLAGWQTLCREVGLDVIPESVTKCKRVSYFSSEFHAVILLIWAGLERASAGEYCRFG